ncbi:MAG: glycosyltransferase [Methanoregula sp.]|nr:MAG: glycosyltransferase [Methanoregula sp.]
MGSVLISPLNWGLGHATRDIPVIHELRRRGHDVTIAACGNALSALKREFPDCQFLDFPDYPAPYSTGSLFLPKFCAYLPLLLRALAAERKALGRILDRDNYDLIISDNRLGVYSDRVPSLFVTHQLHFHFPALIWPVELFALLLNRELHSRFDRVIVPDNPPGSGSLAGKLSRPLLASSRDRIFFAGILATARRMEVAQDLDYLIIISGPEPQRTIFEQIVLPSLPDIPGSKMVLLGSPGGRTMACPDPDTTILSYADTQEKIALLNRAKFVICRSGYTTMMELAEVQKRHGLFVPTPGQTEQEYLSSYYQQKGWFLSRSQYRLDLSRDVSESQPYTGFPVMASTAQNVKILYTEVLAQYVE